MLFVHIILQACDVLSKPQRSLAFLLETYCGVTTNKLFQVRVLAFEFLYFSGDVVVLAMLIFVEASK